MLLIGCHRKQVVIMPGYIEGKFKYIAPNYSGNVKEVYVQAGDRVKAGQALFALELQPEGAEFQAAKARTQETANQRDKALANLNLQKSDNARKNYLYKKDVISKEEKENSDAALAQALAELNAADASLTARRADLDKAKWMTEQKIMNAPIASLVYDVYYTHDEFVPSGHAVLALLPPDKIKVNFFVSEKYISQLRLGQEISFSCDSCKRSVKARISYISTQAEYTPPIIYSAEQRARLVYRYEAIPLAANIYEVAHPGQPVTVTFEVS